MQVATPEVTDFPLLMWKRIPAKRRVLDRTLLPLSFLLHSLCCREKREKLKKLPNGHRMSCCIYLAMQANDSPKIFDDRKLLCFSFFFTFLPENIKHSYSETWLKLWLSDILKLYEFKARIRKLSLKLIIV